MRKWLTVIILLGANVGFGQFGISFHQSNLPFVGLNYEIKDRFIPEIRIGTDNYFENTSIEADVMYKIVRKDDFDFYAGYRCKNKWLHRSCNSCWTKPLSFNK